MKEFHIVANAHIDPVWQWTWEEGAAEAIATFRVAADLCEQYDGFVFNHNEALLYQWVETYEPALFERIQALVAAGKWHILGGWFLQPDCNQPSGESFVRQILLGNHYFYDRFGVKPTVAANFDVFGHTRGLVQILNKSGYDSYLFCRPDETTLTLESENFQWVGFDGSTILAHRSLGFYNSEVDAGADKIQRVTQADPDIGLILWGVGNHGGGVSRKDLENLEQLRPQLEADGFTVTHSTLDAFFDTLRPHKESFPTFADDLWYSMVGCYTSHIRIKQKHRQLESALLRAEKMASHAAMQGLLDYPMDEFHTATENLLAAEFHDALPGTCILSAKEEIIRLLDHGLELMSRIQLRTLFALSAGQQPSQSGDITIMVYNPHPYAVEGIWHTEMHPLRPHWGEGFREYDLYLDDNKLVAQLEKVDGNMLFDWRKRYAFQASFPASSVSTLVAKPRIRKTAPPRLPALVDSHFYFETDRLAITINTTTGLIDRYAVDGTEYLLPGAFAPLVMKDSSDSWGTVDSQYRQLEGRFTLMNTADSAVFSGVPQRDLPPVRIIEDGPVRTIVEAVFAYGKSSLCQQYILPKFGTEVEVATWVYWSEKQRMLKLAIPTTSTHDQYFGQGAYGTTTWDADGRENVSQKWHAVFDADKTKAFTIINDCISGSDMLNGELRLSLLRSPAYAAQMAFDPTMPGETARDSLWDDRFTPHSDQGERRYRFRFNAGAFSQRIEQVTRDAQLFYEDLYMVPFTPPGTGEKPQPMALLSNPNIELVTVKQAESSPQDYIFRLFEPTGQPQQATLQIPHYNITHPLSFAPFEIITLRLNASTGTLTPTDLLEGDIPY